MNLGTFIKQPVDVADYDILYTDWLSEGDQLVLANYLVEPNTDLAVNNLDIVGDRLKIWVAGGVSGASYKLTCTVTTLGGRVRQDEFKIKVKDF